MKICICGPMRGHYEGNRKAFQEAENLIQLYGHSPLNQWYLPLSIAFTREEKSHINKACIDVCDAVYMLDGWEQSEGAKIEYNYAIEQNKLVIIEGELV